MDAVVTGLHHALVQAIRQRRPERVDQPVTVAEIYQELVPYRSVRRLLGIDLIGDYHDALLRLLAGESDHVRLEPAEAREELLEELRSPNPDLEVYRKFAACEVWVDAASADDGSGSAAALPEAALREGPIGHSPSGAKRARSGKGSGAEARRPTGGAAAEARAASRPDAAHPAAPQVVARKVARAPARCASCHEPLPVGKTVRYCPFCGSDRERRPCPACGELLAPAWRFCTACGSAVQP